MEIKIAKTDAEILKCFPVIFQLRPHLKKENFLSQIREQEKAGYFLVFLKNDEKIISVAGCRILKNLAWGKFFFVDDLITDEKYRSQKFGQKLFDFLIELVREKNCRQFHLDSGVQRFSAHRFYLKNKMETSCHHFSLNL